MIQSHVEAIWTMCDEEKLGQWEHLDQVGQEPPRLFTPECETLSHEDVSILL